MRYVVHDAKQAIDVTRTFVFTIDREGDVYVVYQNGDVMCREATSDMVLSRVFGQIRALTLDEMGEWIDLHAATVEHAGLRTVIVGESGSGKSTIAMRLMFAGAATMGDERIMLRGRDSFVYPRRFHLKPDGLKYHPEIAAIKDSLPVVFDETGRHSIFSFAPTDLGFDWSMDIRPIDAVFFIEANKGGDSRSRRIPKIEMAELLTTQLTPPRRERPGWFADIAMLVDAAECRLLYNGDPQLAAQEVLNTLQKLSTQRPAT